MKRIALINDLSGFGRCALSVAIPIISAQGHECCSLPTAILSNHTGFNSYTFFDFTEHMRPFVDKWQENEIEFDAIYSGFLGSAEQVDIVLDVMERWPCALHIVDPVMGDDGQAYDTFDEQLQQQIKRLALGAQIITPNLTELSILCGFEYPREPMDMECLCEHIREFSRRGPGVVITTGIDSRFLNELSEKRLLNLLYNRDNDKFYSIYSRKVPVAYSGTGDVFASALCGGILRGLSSVSAAELAAWFVQHCAEYTFEMDGEWKNGVIFEPHLGMLAQNHSSADNN